MVSFPTHDIDRPPFYSKIDLVLTNKPDCCISVTPNTPLGDSNKHLVVCTSLSLGKKLTHPPKTSSKDFSKADWPSILSFLETVSWSAPYSKSPEAHLEALTSTLHMHINEAIEKIVPTKISGGKRKKA